MDPVHRDRCTLTLQRGDIVVFKHQDSAASVSSELFIKRVIGLPGDTLVFTPDAVIVNGLPFPTPPEAKIPTSPILTSMKPNTRTIVGPDSMFVIGDNRRNSFDSRYWGCIPLGDISGSPFLIYWSFGATKERPLPHVRWERIFSRIY